jgi:methionyl aminopeptidase
MRKAVALTTRALDLLVPMLKPRFTTGALDKFIFEFGRDHDAYSVPMLYLGYPRAIRTSINHIDKPLRDGDILNIDVTLVPDGWHADASRTYVAGEPSRRARRLIEITYKSLPRRGAAVKPGATTGDVGHAIQGYAEGERCSVVHDFCGHGLGQMFHDEPNIPNVGRRGEGIPPPPGMFFTIEPMIKLGHAAVRVLSDGWIAVTRDHSLTALGVTETGIEIFTISPAGLDRPPLSS